ncbi:universal stress protein [Rhodococcus opacus]|uniref:universal stress protein n=1 Tax=Rhodococcus opacus TaxID=37919 RepID=UPI0007CD4EB4|nr:universal stress protein [Rhodococcus opacus]MDX5962454.1 universal stress protein [Rhodococcus opacus]CAG7639937.1 Universal stress protein [Rhodococcus opacus]
MNINRPIVVGVDGSASSLDAVRWAAEAAVRRESPLVLVSALLTPGQYGVPDAIPSGYFDTQETESKKILEHAADLAARTARGRTLEIETDLRRGPVIGVLLDHVQTAEMVVLGWRGLDEFTGMLVGSVAAALTTHGLCPVAVIRGLPGPEEPDLDGPIVVGVDGTKNSKPVLAAAFEEASLRGTALVAVHAWSDYKLSMFFPDDTEFDWAPHEIAAQATLARTLSGWREDYPDVAVRTVIVRDRPVRNLLAQAERAQLLVVGSHGRGGYASMLVGSTSRALLQSAQCPLLIAHGRH